MAELFDRRWSVEVGDLDVTEIDLSFRIEKSTRREPNTCELTLFNLAPETIARLKATDNPRITIRAGYRDDGDPPPILFVGDSRRLVTVRTELDYETRITARDSGRNYNQLRIERSYSAGTPASRVLRDTVQALEIGEGNLADFENAYQMRNGQTSFPDGFVASGPAHRVLNTLVRAAGLRWSVQNGSLQLQRRGRPLQDQAILLSPSSGLVGSPTADERGLVSAQSLLIPGLNPGRSVVLESSLIEGSYEIRKVQYTGQTQGNEWYATMELKPL